MRKQGRRDDQQRRPRAVEQGRGRIAAGRGVAAAAVSSGTGLLSSTSDSTSSSWKSASLSFSILCALLLLIFGPSPCECKRRRKNGHPDSRFIRVINNSTAKIDIFWINAETRELGPSNTNGGLFYGGDTGIGSFVGHAFEVQELPPANAKVEGKCRGGRMCRKGYFKVNANEDQWFTVNEDFDVIVEDNTSRAAKKAKDAVTKCGSPYNLMKKLKEASSSSSSSLSSSIQEELDSISACIERSIDDTITEMTDNIDYQTSVRHGMGKKLVQYICSPDARYENITKSVTKTKESVHNRTWTYTVPERYRQSDFVVSTAPGSSMVEFTSKKKPVKKKRVSTIRHKMEYLFESTSNHNEVVLIHDVLSESSCREIVEGSTKMSKGVSNNRTRTLSWATSLREASGELDFSFLKLEDLFDAATSRQIVDYVYDGDDTKTIATKNGDVDGPFLTIRTRKAVTEPACRAQADDGDGPAGGSCPAEDDEAEDDGEEDPDDIKDEQTIVMKIDDRIQLASLYVFCEIPAAGGGFHFPKIGVHVQPTTPGDAVLVLYRRQDDMSLTTLPTTAEDDDDEEESKNRMSFIDEYAICPVTNGTLTYLEYHI